MSTNKSADTSFRDLVARLNAMSNVTPEEERAQLMEAAGKAPKVLDDKDISLADIAKLAGIKEYVEPTPVSEKAEKLVESIVAEPKQESVITKAIKESDADESLATSIKKEVNEEVNRLEKIAELEAQLAELKTEQKEEQTYDSKGFREVITKDIAEYIKGAEDSALVELYNTISDNEAVYNEESSSILIKTPETTEIIADAEKAEAPEEEILSMWQGLGYYSRGRNLRKAAIQVMEEYNGKFPVCSKELIKLKGIGDYSAAAIASFSNNEKIAVVDGNVYRVLSRLFGIETPIDSSNGKKEFSALANALISPKHPAIHNQAIMEFGALQCTPKAPLCNQCVFGDVCEAYNKNNILSLPVKSKKTKRKTK